MGRSLQRVKQDRQAIRQTGMCVFMWESKTHYKLVLFYCAQSVILLKWIKRPADRWVKQADRKCVNDRSQMEIKEEELWPCQMHVSSKNPHCLSTSLSTFLSSSTSLSSERRFFIWALQRQNESAINPAVSPFSNFSLSLSLSETVNRINWLCVLDVGL